ncbi:polyketide cyclase/dehydrase/lipid transport protein [Kribbella voronezhensis]|uniref:Polyketide cyclase/dehydrase/lipid transport protein n=1 Tax=Kribbella voronezhensis TaxID=2512212 RepID=A0A4R7SYF7_9ACTN|nr:SRPBCC family protein [Kribbella voronezhensis]TDU83547.1 polyketide cyclase/dehydrase/lipid transport protein [Kribbella voronezhensis]
MLTNFPRAETRTISIAASPEVVFEYVADARNLPEWAPGFAPKIEQSGDEWVIDSEAGQLRVVVRTSSEYGTVDFLRAHDLRVGGFSRVLPNGEGSEYQFTILFPPGTPEEAVEDQLKFIDEELETVRRICEGDQAV